MKKPDSKTGLTHPHQPREYRDLHELHGRNFDGSWCKQSMWSKWLRHQLADVEDVSESGETFDKEAAMTRKERGYFKK